MIDLIIRSLKRAAVLVPGLIAAYLVTTDVYPVLNREVPAALAVLIAYVIMAYGLIPSLLRVFRFFVRPKHIPLYCVTADGFASDPINVGIIGTRQQAIKAMTDAGWHLADKRTVKNVIRLGLSLVLKRSYPTAPFSHLYLFGRKQDFGFQLPVNNSPHSRHHVRFWAAAPTMSATQREHLDFWRQHLPGRRATKNQLWVGAASLDIGLGVILHNAQLTHTVHPDTDAERDLIISMLNKSGWVKSTRTTRIGEAYRLRNRVFRAHLKTDGKMTIATLKP